MASRLDWVAVPPSVQEPVPGHPGYRTRGIHLVNKGQSPSAFQRRVEECAWVCGQRRRAPGSLGRRQVTPEGKEASHGRSLGKPTGRREGTVSHGAGQEPERAAGRSWPIRSRLYSGVGVPVPYCAKGGPEGPGKEEHVAE